MPYSLRCWRDSRIQFFGLIVYLLGTALNSEVNAQIIPDNTLGAENSIVTPLNGQSDRIDGGAIRGSNLFHSFQEFSIREGHGAYFSNPEAIQAIFSRVTGNNPSLLFGTLGVLGNANLFFINPNGVIFGPNASLDIRGSFVTSTANGIIFPDGSRFSATNPEGVPLLTVNVPVVVGLQFEGNGSGAIINAGNLATGKNLALIGDTVVSTGTLSALKGEINLSTVAGETQLQVDGMGKILGEKRLRSVDGNSSGLFFADWVSKYGKDSGLMFDPSGEVILAGTQTAVKSGDIVVTGSLEKSALRAQTARLSAVKDLTLIESQMGTMGDMALLAGDTVRIRDGAGSPLVVVAGGDLTVQGDRQVDIFALNHPASGLLSGRNMVLRSGSEVIGDAHYWSGSSFRVEKLDRSLGNLLSNNDPVIRSVGDVNFLVYQGQSLHILSGGSVNINTVIITGVDTVGQSINPTSTPELATVPLSDGTQVVINGSTRPTLDIRAGMEPNKIGTPLGTLGTSGIFIDNNFNITDLIDSNPIATTADINIGLISIQSPSGQVLLTNQYKPNPLILGGDIIIGGVSILTNSNGGILTIDKVGDITFFEGNGGDVIIDSREQFVLLENNLITASSLSGYGGDIKLLAQKDIRLLPNTFIVSQGILGGNISLISRENIIQQSSVLSNADSNHDTDLQSGKIYVEADIITLNQGRLLTGSSRGNSQAGDIEIYGDSLSLINGGIIASSSLDRGKTGNISIDIRDKIQLFGIGQIEVNESSFPLPSAITLSITQQGKADTGNVNINANSLTIEDTGSILITNFGDGNTGQLSLNIREGITLKSSFITNNVQNQGQGGDINIKTGFVELLEGSQIATGLARSQFLPGSASNGSSGNIYIDATKYVRLSGTLPNFVVPNPTNPSETFSGEGSATAITASAPFGTSGSPGSIIVNTPIFQVTNGAAVETYTASANPAGNIIINADILELTKGGQLISTTLNDGNAGKIELNLSKNLLIEGIDPTFVDRLEKFGSNIVTNQGSESGIFANTTPSSKGNSGDIIINEPNFVVIRDSGKITVETSGAGKPGNIDITTNTLTIGKNAQLSATSTATATNRETGGSINLNANQINLSGKLGIFAETQSIAPAGNLTLQPNNTPNLNINFTDNGFISARTVASGQGGNININAPQTLDIRGQGKITVETEGSGNAGNINLSSQTLNLSDGVEITASTTGEGKAGNIDLNAKQITLNNAQITATTSGGKGGSLNLYGNTLSLNNGSQIRTTTNGSNNAGDITLKIQDNITLTGSNSGIFADTDLNALGNGGKIFIDPITFTIRDGAAVSVNSQGKGTGGDIEIYANTLTLDNGRITAQTRSTNGGNITLRIQDILQFRNGSQISTTAGTAQTGGDGGNIDIDSAFILSNFYENNDITANAFVGRGGNIKITVQGILGFLITDGLSPFSDITASSEFGLDGDIILNTIGIDLTRGLEKITTQSINPQIRQGCLATGGKSNAAFYNLGRGGLPESPEDTLGENLEGIWVPWAETSLETHNEISNQSEKVANTPNKTLYLSLPCQTPSTEQH